MKTLTNIKLHPVIDLHPFNLGAERYPRLDTPEEHDQFWRGLLEKKGLEKLNPIVKGLFYVKIEDIDDESLRILTEWGLGNIPVPCIPNDEDEALPSSFEGGIIMTSGDKIIVKPQCCVSLQDYKEWTSLKPSVEPQRIWVGHPWIYYITQGEKILLSRMIEKDFENVWRYYDLPKDPLDYPAYRTTPEQKIDKDAWVWQIDLEEFNKAGKELEEALTSLKKRLIPMVRELGQEEDEKLANCLVDGNGYWLSYS